MRTVPSANPAMMVSCVGETLIAVGGWFEKGSIDVSNSPVRRFIDRTFPVGSTIHAVVRYSSTPKWGGDASVRDSFESPEAAIVVAFGESIEPGMKRGTTT